MKLILTRHGETVGNLKGIVQGRLQGKLSEKGIEQAKKTALRLKDEKIDAIYSSDLKRAADTAKEIAKYHPDTPLVYAEELREMDYGSLTGKKISEIDWKNLPRDAEDNIKMQDRMKRFLDKIYKKHPEDTILFVSHGRVGASLINLIMGKSPKEIHELKKLLGKLYNASISIFEIREDKKHNIILLNCVKHLE
ncbi:histidine phosphatase family protein [Candidatus Woesearchaeota archaeon]|nr:histidine phosphatase family protein [Candidatus Woesearchaeota archaeon]